MEYIGLHKKHLYILDILCSHVAYKERGQIISNKDVILIVLMTIRTGSAEYMIAHRFGVSSSCVSRILTRFIPVISGCLKELIVWPPSETIRSRLPHSFKAYHHKVESIGIWHLKSPDTWRHCLSRTVIACALSVGNVLLKSANTESF